MKFRVTYEYGEKYSYEVEAEAMFDYQLHDIGDEPEQFMTLQKVITKTTICETTDDVPSAR